MGLRTLKVLGHDSVKAIASGLLGDIEHSLTLKENSHLQFLRFGHKHREQFEAYSNMNSSQRRDEIIRQDHIAAREAIMADAIMLYLDKLNEEKAEQATEEAKA